MEERVGLYENNNKKSIVEECSSKSEKCESFKDKKISWADVVKGGKI